MTYAYLIGIKGVGMTALAKFLIESGYRVEGSDNSTTYVTDEILAQNKIKVFSPFNKNNLKDNPELVIVSAAYGEDHVEVQEAKTRGIKVIYYSEALGLVTRNKKLIAVSGVHGKTTTTSLLALLLKNANLDPSFIIGAGNVGQLGTNAHAGAGQYCVIEADEYRKSPSDLTPKFLDLKPDIAIISSIELDHPDIFPTEEDIYKAFCHFANQVKEDGLIILNIDYPRAKDLKQKLTNRKFETYGLSADADWQLTDFKEGEETSFSLKHDGKVYGPYSMGIPGKHNALNATTAVILSCKININEQILKKTLMNFQGVQRRFEIVAKIGDIILIDDYAHHPTAIRNTIETVKTKYAGFKIYCIFQPHTHSRTESLLKEFSEAFSLSDDTIITDIYASEREKPSSITSVDLVKMANKDNIKYIAKWAEIKQYLKKSISGKAIILTIGAGDIYKLAHELAEELRSESNG